MAHHVDNVLTLGEGGSLKSFETSTMWISRTSLSDDKSENTTEETDSIELEEDIEILPKTERAVEEKDPHEEIKRQIGDATVWTYYAKSAGLVSVILLAFFTAVYTISMAFPSESKYCLHANCENIDKNFRALA
jgi:hypothetical protein